ncbi:hypothetical protein EJ05DRAFT_486951 [Pseudovirgaria hyperparasitica]|uniref:Uncharacterized protein n=1 Tax=Pseudovirgaria hyperparasitica TaxID=470096 RepID=A0A6A6W224_9PEZI|nr:uncharacterized protein EJ05DRAFT_486951 [Pseudovirgaria hyperparasitica]KAF2756942.1 hypothetical protein EJ05DRAFT_486951 [Pseudovirgaria hyperparasitica]
MKFSLIIPAMAAISSVLALPTGTFGGSANAGVSAGLGGITGGASGQVGGQFTIPSAINFGAGITVEACEASIQAWLQAKGLCEVDGSIGAKAQAYLNGVLHGQTGLEGLFGMAAGINLGGQVGASVDPNTQLITSAIQGLLSGTFKFTADMSGDLFNAAIKGWLQAAGLCEADGSIGATAEAYINAFLNGATAFEGLFGITEGIKLGTEIVGQVEGIASDVLKGNVSGVLSKSISIGGEVASEFASEALKFLSPFLGAIGLKN